MNISILEVFKTSFTLVILLLCSVIALAASIEKWLYLRKCRLDAGVFMKKIETFLEKSCFEDALTHCTKHPAPLSHVIKIGIINRKKNKEDISELMESAKMEERIKMDGWLGILGTLGNASPFIGLFGTVVGIIKAFEDLAKSGSGGPAIVAAGIAEALVATAGGLVVAIPCVVAFNFFQRKIKVMNVEIDVAMKRLLVYLNK